MAYHTPVGKLMEEMDSAEYAEMIAFAQLEPFGEYRQDVRSAMIAMTIAKCNSHQSFSLDDFIPKFGRAREETPEETGAKLMMFAKQYDAAQKQAQRQGQ